MITAQLSLVYSHIISTEALSEPGSQNKVSLEVNITYIKYSEDPMLPTYMNTKSDGFKFSVIDSMLLKWAHFFAVPHPPLLFISFHIRRDLWQRWIPPFEQGSAKDA